LGRWRVTGASIANRGQMKSFTVRQGIKIGNLTYFFDRYIIMTRKQRVRFFNYGAALTALLVNLGFIMAFVFSSRRVDVVLSGYSSKLDAYTGIIDALERRLSAQESPVNVPANVVPVSNDVPSVVRFSDFDVVGSICYFGGSVYRLGDSTRWGVIRYISADKGVIDSPDEGLVEIKAQLLTGDVEIKAQLSTGDDV